MRTVARAAALAAVCGLAAGCGGSVASGEGAGAFVTRILREEVAGRWAAQWSELHPGQQKLITRAQYVACSRGLGTNVGTGREVFTVRGVRDAPIHVRGVPERTAELVTVEFRQPGTASAILRVHAVRDRGRWTWILSRSFLDALARGRCLDGSPLPPP